MDKTVSVGVKEANQTVKEEYLGILSERLIDVLGGRQIPTMHTLGTYVHIVRSVITHNPYDFYESHIKGELVSCYDIDGAVYKALPIRCNRIMNPNGESFDMEVFVIPNTDMSITSPLNVCT
jgi:hypothetical protein